MAVHDPSTVRFMSWHSSAFSSESHLDRVEVGQGAYDDDLTGDEQGAQVLIDTSLDGVAVDRPVQHEEGLPEGHVRIKVAMPTSRRAAAGSRAVAAAGPQHLLKPAHAPVCVARDQWISLKPLRESRPSRRSPHRNRSCGRSRRDPACGLSKSGTRQLRARSITRDCLVCSMAEISD